MQNAILNAETLLKKKKIIEDIKNKKIDITIEELGTFRFRIPRSDDFEALGGFEEAQKDLYLVYSCCDSPNLKDENLQKAFDINGEPFEIVNEIFLPGQVKKITEKLLEASGYNDRAVKIEKIKN